RTPPGDVPSPPPRTLGSSLTATPLKINYTNNVPGRGTRHEATPFRWVIRHQGFGAAAAPDGWSPGSGQPGWCRCGRGRRPRCASTGRPGRGSRSCRISEVVNRVLVPPEGPPDGPGELSGVLRYRAGALVDVVHAEGEVLSRYRERRPL